MITTRRIPTWLALAVMALSVASAHVAHGADASEKEQELLAVLSSDAALGEKAITCKRLAVYGSSAAVPELAKLLGNEQLASWARIPLEVIPGPAADEALRQSLDSLDGKLLVGVINSIGIRRDPAAVQPLVARLTHSDAQVASAAAVALGRIGDGDATTALRGALATVPAEVRSAVAEGLVLCAEQHLAKGQASVAVEIYDQVRQAEVARPRIIEATRGAILARGKDGLPLLVEMLRSSDRGLFRIALTTARELPGAEVDAALAEEVQRATPDRAALFVQAMVDRTDTVHLPSILAAASNGPKPVRLAAISALGRVGDASCLSPLLEMALEGDAELSQAARSALAVLPGESINAEIIGRLSQAEGKMYPLLLGVAGQRRVPASTELLKAAEHPDQEVRSAALLALGATILPEQLAALIQPVLKPRNADDAKVAQQALRDACVRMPDREACAADLGKALERAPVATQRTLLEILGAVGGTEALATIGKAAKGKNDELQDTGTRLLGAWMSVDAGPVLLDLAKTNDKYHSRAIRGYIRLARQFTMPPEERAVMCQQALSAARQDAERKLVLEVLRRYPHVDTLKVAVNAAQTPALKQDATQAALAIAQRLGSQTPGVVDLLGKVGLERVKLQIVKATYGAGTTQKDVTEILRKHVGDLPLITLPSPSFNEAFGGDPAPGTTKQLKVQYQLNGKAGEITLAENALILFPTP